MSSRIRGSALFVFAALALAACAEGGAIGTGDEPPTITARGVGRVTGVPDTVVITIGVETEGAQASEALSRNNERARTVIDLLKQQGRIADEDIQTSQFSISPRFDNEGRSIVGYIVSNILTARVSGEQDTGALIDAAAQAADNDIRVQSVRFEIDDEGPLFAEARREAVEEAERQAEQLAEAAGIELGDVRRITESSTTPPPPGPLPLGRTDVAAGAPIEPGSQEITLEVEVVYEISD